MAQLHYLIIPRCVHTRPRFKALDGFPPPPARGARARLRVRARTGAREPTVSTASSETCRSKSSTCVASPQVVSKRGAARSCVALFVHVASGSHVVLPDVASVAHVASGSQLASPDVVSKRGVTCPPWRQGSRLVFLDVASKRGVTCAPGVREPCGVADVASRRGVTCTLGSQGASWHRQIWCQNVASLAHLASGNQVASPDVASKRGSLAYTWRRGATWPERGVKRHRPTRCCKTWRPARVFKMGVQSLGDVHPHRRPPCFLGFCVCISLPSPDSVRSYSQTKEH